MSLRVKTSLVYFENVAKFQDYIRENFSDTIQHLHLLNEKECPSHNSTCREGPSHNSTWRNNKLFCITYPLLSKLCVISKVTLISFLRYLPSRPHASQWQLCASTPLINGGGPSEWNLFIPKQRCLRARHDSSGQLIERTRREWFSKRVFVPFNSCLITKK